MTMTYKLCDGIKACMVILQPMEIDNIGFLSTNFLSVMYVHYSVNHSSTKCIFFPCWTYCTNYTNNNTPLLISLSLSSSLLCFWGLVPLARSLGCKRRRRLYFLN